MQWEWGAELFVRDAFSVGEVLGMLKKKRAESGTAWIRRNASNISED